MAAARVSDAHSIASSSRLSTSSQRSRLSIALAAQEDNAKALEEVTEVDLFPPTGQRARRMALSRSSRSLAVHDDTLSHAQRRELLKVANDTDADEKPFDDVFERFLDVVGSGEGGLQDEQGSEASNREDDEGGAKAAAPIASIAGGADGAWRRVFLRCVVATPLFGLFLAAFTLAFRNRLRQKLGLGALWVPLLALWDRVSDVTEDAREWLWEGLCEGARSRFFENCFVLLAGWVIARLPSRASQLLEWIVE